MRIIVTRHAKSSWDAPHLDDHDRPLSRRGRKSSDAIGQWLSDHGYIPQLVLSSTSQRTRETWSRMEKFMPGGIDVRYESSLYHGNLNAFASLLLTAADEPVLFLGHNPGIGMFAESVLECPPRDASFMQYPTAATLVCDLPCASGAEFRLGAGQLVDFVIPRQLI